MNITDNELNIYLAHAENGVHLYVIARSMEEALSQLEGRDVSRIKALGPAFKPSLAPVFNEPER